MRKLLFAVAAALFLSACGETTAPTPSTGVRIQTTGQGFSRGTNGIAVVTYLFTNGTAGTITVPTCNGSLRPFAVEEFENGAWVRSFPPACPDGAPNADAQLSAGDRFASDYQFTEAGRYRLLFVIGVVGSPATFEILSNEFDVT